MIQEIQHTNIPIMFNEDEPTKEDADAQELDALQPINDWLRLRLSWSLPKTIMWWFLEIIPTSHAFETTQGKLDRIWR